MDHRLDAAATFFQQTDSSDHDRGPHGNVTPTRRLCLDESVRPYLIVVMDRRRDRCKTLARAEIGKSQCMPYAIVLL